MRVFLLVAVTLLFIALGALEVVASRAVLPLPGSPTNSAGTSVWLASRTWLANRCAAGPSPVRCSNPNQAVERCRSATSFSGNTA